MLANSWKYSNLLQPNPQYFVHSFDFHTSTNLQHGNVLLERMKRKSLQLGSVDTKRQVKQFSTSTQKKSIQDHINKSKINRLLLQTKFDKECDLAKNKKKRVFVIRKRQEKQKIRMKQQQSSDKQGFFNESYRSNTQPIQQIQKKQMFKIKRKMPKFGIEDIIPKICEKKKLGETKTAGLLMTTSSNHFYNTSFYLSSKTRQPHQNSQLTQSQKSDQQFQPEIKVIIPNQFSNEYALLKRKQRMKFYNTNANFFSFQRSKTEQFEHNDLCAWQKDSVEQNQSQNYI